MREGSSTKEPIKLRVRKEGCGRASRGGKWEKGKGRKGKGRKEKRGGKEVRKKEEGRNEEGKSEEGKNEQEGCGWVKRGGVGKMRKGRKGEEEE